MRLTFPSPRLLSTRSFPTLPFFHSRMPVVLFSPVSLGLLAAFLRSTISLGPLVSSENWAPLFPPPSTLSFEPHLIHLPPHPAFNSRSHLPPAFVPLRNINMATRQIRPIHLSSAPLIQTHVTFCFLLLPYKHVSRSLFFFRLALSYPSVMILLTHCLFAPQFIILFCLAPLVGMFSCILTLFVTSIHAMVAF